MINLNIEPECRSVINYLALGKAKEDLLRGRVGA